VRPDPGVGEGAHGVTDGAFLFAQQTIGAKQFKRLLRVLSHGPVPHSDIR